MRTCQELLDRYQQIYGHQPCINLAYLQDRVDRGQVRQISSDGYGLFDKDNKDNEFLIHFVWFGETEEETKTAVKQFKTRG